MGKLSFLQLIYLLTNKAMRLEKNFGLKVFPVFWTFRTFRIFGLQNKSGTRPLFSNVRNFCETYRKSYRK